MPYVSVRALGVDKKAMVFVEPTCTIAELKLKIAEQLQVAPRSQTLVYRGRDLKNAQTLEDCDIAEATSITLFEAKTNIAPLVAKTSTANNIAMAAYAMGLLVSVRPSFCTCCISCCFTRIAKHNV